MKFSNRYFIMRHGLSEANRDGLICSAPAAGISTCGLTEEGRRQAGDAVKGRGEFDENTVIYSSDFLRARQTAEAVSAITGSRWLNFTPLLRERFFGDFESLDQRHYATVWENDRGDPHNRKHNVESPEQVKARVCALIDQCEKSHQGQTILLVSHGDTLQILYTVWRGHSPDRHREIPPIRNGDIILLEESDN